MEDTNKPSCCGVSEVKAVTDSCCGDASAKDCCPKDGTEGCGSDCKTNDSTCCPSKAKSKGGVIRIEVVGSGCASCHQLHEAVKKLAPEIGFENEVVYLSNQKGMQRIVELGLMQSPVLVVDGKIAMVGYSPSAQKIKIAILETAAKK